MGFEAAVVFAREHVAYPWCLPCMAHTLVLSSPLTHTYTLIIPTCCSASASPSRLPSARRPVAASGPAAREASSWYACKQAAAAQELSCSQCGLWGSSRLPARRRAACSLPLDAWKHTAGNCAGNSLVTITTWKNISILPYLETVWKHLFPGMVKLHI